MSANKRSMWRQDAVDIASAAAQKQKRIRKPTLIGTLPGTRDSSSSLEPGIPTRVSQELSQSEELIKGRSMAAGPVKL
ncbi:uncharacterized protein CTHT_0053260 [Thermochaetoides thermophila DSM 1495]|uniref:Uncharacterized protein n=1 Tax=Chaetomium thermophilum (strain DSM 1495 / CBS 144.50 / IMI 039719) TaxID=759272 RepID=G0SDW7_CHATD|nr:hypothetical protein CTHT_0053260 [Thermochaetoides thermophila DSM 1495]EGS18718.1 hypothetical protein CTHT_0053260 [Thermochaetoides thermophila DSM 1495]